MAQIDDPTNPPVITEVIENTAATGGLCTLTIHGSNTFVSGSLVDKATITALSDVTAVNYNCIGLFPSVKYTANEVDLIDGNSRVSKTVQIIFAPQTMPIKFPVNITNTEILFGIAPIRKKYTWIDLNSFPIILPNYTSDKLIRVEVTGFEIKDNGNGEKTITFELKAKL